MIWTDEPNAPGYREAPSSKTESAQILSVSFAATSTLLCQQPTLPSSRSQIHLAPFHVSHSKAETSKQRDSTPTNVITEPMLPLAPDVGNLPISRSTVNHMSSKKAPQVSSLPAPLTTLSVVKRRLGMAGGGTSGYLNKKFKAQKPTCTHDA